MRRRDFISTLLYGLYSGQSFASILDMFRKNKSSLPPPGKYTPADNLFIVDIKGVPEGVKRLNLKDYRLRVFGKVKNTRMYSFEEIRKMPSLKREIILECVSNSKGDKVGRLLFEGVDLNYIIDSAGIFPNARKVVFRSFDDYHTGIEISYVREFKPMVVHSINYDEDGKVMDKLPLDHGYPLRVICPEKWGYKSAKWIKEIEIVDYDYRGYWEKAGWNDRALRGVDYFDFK